MEEKHRLGHHLHTSAVVIFIVAHSEKCAGRHEAPLQKESGGEERMQGG
jgi:hypothetical protein